MSLDSQVSRNIPAGYSFASWGLSTSAPGDLLVAYVSSDGPAAGGGQWVNSVSGAGLTWTRAAISNQQFGDTEVWTAQAPWKLSKVKVYASMHAAGYEGSITVAAFKGSAGHLGAVAVASSGSGAARVSLRTTAAGSWIWGVGHDWDNAIRRTVATGQSLVDQYLDTSMGDTSWTQRMNATTPQAGAVVTLSDPAPTSDRWDAVAVEVIP